MELAITFSEAEWSCCSRGMHDTYLLGPALYNALGFIGSYTLDLGHPREELCRHSLLTFADYVGSRIRHVLK
jgi:hypothetical protein